MRRPIRIGFVGDPHVGRAERWTDAATALELHRRMLQQQLSACRRHHCTHAVILGDVFDAPVPSQNKIVMVARELSRHDIPIAVPLGNHDVLDAATNALSVLSVMPELGAITNVSWIHRPTTLSWRGWNVLVLPWGTRLPDGRPDVVVFHDAVPGARLDNGRAATGGLQGISGSDVPCVGGHLHVPQRRGLLCFPGTAAQMSFGEPPGKRFVWLTLHPDREPAYGSEPIDDPIWRLERVVFDAEDPPRCDDPNTFYSVDISGDRPPPRWLATHPRVVTTHGSNSARVARATSRVVSLMDGGANAVEDDRVLLGRWLRQHTSLTDLARAHAMRLHNRFAGDAS